MAKIGNRPLFKIIEPDGSVKEVFEDGKISGFEAGSIVVNHYPALVTEAITLTMASGDTPYQFPNQ